MEFVLFIWLMCGLVGWGVASQKGLNGCGWAILCSLLGVFGLIMVLVAKPDKAVLEKQELEQGISRKCPECAELVKADAVKCRYCGSVLPVLPKPKPEPSEPIAGYCFLCGFALREPVDRCPKCGRKDPLTPSYRR